MTERAERAVMTNLADAGCGGELIERFLQLLKNGQKEAGLALLAEHRRVLLDCCHAEEKKIECLDYLIYQLKQQAD
ncbi:hypothetical protein D1159_02130 [Pseudoflavonifractor sp. 524-17]|uniref:hypothetical protein n=1 Tax=Pseudoflavonifractor sp. 524-17 TaxID=2304577 RepID=UPI0013799888|nr:hypothetical protein [Pseudoflavonifractor sp. 524-17]NCE63406.1 hypothetical protein [Pseudoflavonifractor sp. 524-17]